MLLKEKIPLIYHHLLTNLLEIEVPDEKLSPCQNCNLCQNQKSPYLDTKCCNYHPIQVNYLLGAILQDQNASMEYGRKQIRIQIQAQKGVSPFGIEPDKIYLANQERILLKETIFQSKEEIDSQRCPYYDQGNCSVWQYREHLCVTYFCASVSGSVGHAFWRELDEILREMEHKLANFVTQKLGFSIKGPISNQHQSSDNENWKTQNLDLEAFYKKAYGLVLDMKKETFHQLMGEDWYKKIEDLTLQAEMFRATKFPSLLKLNESLKIIKLDSGNLSLHVGNLSEEISPIVYNLIKLFDGKRSTEDVYGKAFQVLYNLNEHLEIFIEKGILVAV